MTNQDLEDFGRAIVGLAEVHGRQTTPQLVRLYWSALQHWRRDEFLAAAKHFLRARFMPKPFDFEQLRRSGMPTAAEAWARVLTHTRGPYRDGSGLDDDGPIDRAVAGLGGYRALAFRDTQYLAIDERRFVAVFDQLVDVDEARRAVPEIASKVADGLLDHDGRRK
jgi:hypothetical protein